MQDLETLQKTNFGVKKENFPNNSQDSRERGLFNRLNEGEREKWMGLAQEGK